ncbi:unnamed protein product [Prorocentrum cordatum]|uniref:Uncharacterized protein n=1 Tax=Prorocentrum cordatum TaxID=2364126 RepID=A0ABN9X1M7_9DINO|nr:unnamed protein product [Polarella glacialis]
MAAEGDAEEGPDLALVEVVELRAEPNDCAFGERLCLSMSFTVDRDLAGHFWQVRYIVDTSKKRVIIGLGSTEAFDYPQGGPWSMTFEVPSIDVGDVPPSLLAQQDGLLVAALTGPSGEEVSNVNMVVQVRPDGSGLRRYVINPLE